MMLAPASKAPRCPWVLGLLALVGCATPGVEPIIGPDGAPMLFIHCGTDQSQCFRLAGERCPNGYDFAPVHAEKAGNYFVRCRREVALESAPSRAAAPPAAQTFAVPSHSSAPPASTGTQSDWPPGVVGRATEPWQSQAPPAASGGVPTGGLPPTPRTQLGEVDVGY